MGKPEITRRSMGVTIRPSDGLTDEMVEVLLAKLKSSYQCGAKCAIEKKGHERHAHFQLWFDKPKRPSDVKSTYLDKVLKPYLMSHPKWNYIKSNGIYVTIAYSCDWINTYCTENSLKTDEVNILYENLPDDYQENQYYPSQEEQDAVQAKANAVDQMMHDYEVMFYNWFEQTQPPCQEITCTLVATFLSTMAYSERKIKTMHRKLDRQNLTTTLTAYINRSCDPSHYYTPPETKETKHLRSCGLNENEILKCLPNV